jgi:undecaprenyl-diphosphatase
MALDVTALGSVTVLTGAIIATLGYLLMRRFYSALWLVLAASIGGELLSAGLKWLFDRPRPDAQWRIVDAMTASFPSGHAMLGAIVYLTLGALLARLEPRHRMKAYIIAASMLLVMFIGLSRVYLGVHYATDVLAGWCAGLAWALACWLVAKRLQHRGQIEATSTDEAI